MDQGELYTQKIEVLLDMQNKKLLAELEGIKKELQDLKDQVAAIKRASAAPAPPPTPPPQPPSAQSPPPQAAAPEQAAPAEPAAEPAPQAEPASDKPIDRNNVAPGDVSIEKMFYYGQK